MVLEIATKITRGGNIVHGLLNKDTLTPEISFIFNNISFVLQQRPTFCFVLAQHQIQRGPDNCGSKALFNTNNRLGIIVNNT